MRTYGFSHRSREHGALLPFSRDAMQAADLRFASAGANRVVSPVGFCLLLNGNGNFRRILSHMKLSFIT